LEHAKARRCKGLFDITSEKIEHKRKDSLIKSREWWRGRAKIRTNTHFAKMLGKYKFMWQMAEKFAQSLPKSYFNSLYQFTILSLIFHEIAPSETRDLACRNQGVMRFGGLNV
jgi:hypothetical protein